MYDTIKSHNYTPGMTSPTINIAAQIERTLTVEILRGAHPADTRLPTVRALATRFEVTPATVQRALARLEMTGLVTARQGSGTTVNNAEEVGGLGLVPAWLQAMADQPERAGRILGDFLEIRRIVASRLLVRHRVELVEALPELGKQAVALTQIDPTDIDALRSADLGFARSLLRRTGNLAALSVLNTAGDVLRTVPHVAEAMYAEPLTNAQSMGEVLQALVSEIDDGALNRTVEASIAAVDAGTVRRFEARLRAALS